MISDRLKASNNLPDDLATANNTNYQAERLLFAGSGAIPNGFGFAYVMALSVENVYSILQHFFKRSTVKSHLSASGRQTEFWFPKKPSSFTASEERTVLIH